MNGQFAHAVSTKCNLSVIIVHLYHSEIISEENSVDNRNTTRRSLEIRLAKINTEGCPKHTEAEIM